MKANYRKHEREGSLRLILILIGIAVNVLLSLVCCKFKLPLYLDTAGTIVVSVLAGYFPGVVTGVSTNLACYLFNEYSIYFGFISALIAIFTALFSKKRSLREPVNIVIYVLVISFISGVISAFNQWGIEGGPQNEAINDASVMFSQASGLPLFRSFVITNTVYNFIDKTLTTGLALLTLFFIPLKIRTAIRNSGWVQKPLTDEELKSFKKRNSDILFPIGRRMSLIFLVLSFGLVLVMGSISLQIYYDRVREERTDYARRAAIFAADVIDPDRISDYLANGRAAEGYDETERILYRIRDMVKDIRFLYVLKVEEGGCNFIFDLEGYDGEEPYAPGEFVPFEEEFTPYLDDLYAGREIEPVVTNGVWNWLLTVYYPVLDENGICVCYVGADVSLNYVTEYLQSFILKVMLVMAGFFMLIVTYGIYTSNIYMAYPINAIASCVDGFTKGEETQEELDRDVKTIQSLDIHTNDEVEQLYRAICRMTSGIAEQMRETRYYAESNQKMQNGLIITMADMVENRDSDTGAHVQKTSAYVRIILNGLRRRGYYPEKLTDKYINDVVMSAPLHDVGKINIPDSILNKPGKLTDEEYEIMKTHTTAGKKILENAIATVKGENYLKEARNMAAYHHERWDGKGYPEGLHGEVIPLSARVMSVADVFDALASPRVYKPAFPLEKALSIIEEGKGTQFDPKCVEVFMESLPEVKKVLKQYQKE